jgi:hypothetical protein
MAIAIAVLPIKKENKNLINVGGMKIQINYQSSTISKR